MALTACQALTVVPRIRQSGDGGGGGEGGFVFAGEFLEAVHGSWGASEDRFVGKITLNVGGQGAGRFVAAGAVFFEGFHHDPIEFAAEDLAEPPLIETAVLRDRRDGLSAERAEAAAGTQRLVFADDPPHLVEAGLG